MIRQTLAEPMNSLGLDFNDAPLSEVVGFIIDEYSLEVQLDNAALDDLGLSPDEAVSATIRNTTLGNALRHALRQLDLDYVITSEMLLITSEDQALRQLKTAVYPIGDILSVKSANVSDAPGVKNDEISGSFDSIMDVIISTVASDTWVANGGLAEIRPIQPGLLVISQTDDAHQQIQGLLSALRQAKQHETAVPVQELHYQNAPGMGEGARSGE